MEKPSHYNNIELDGAHTKDHIPGQLQDTHLYLFVYIVPSTTVSS